MGEARRRKRAGDYPDPAKIERQAADGVIVVSFDIAAIPPLTCVLPTKNALARLDDLRRLFRAPYPNLLRALLGEFTEANRTQDKTIIESANIFALCAVMQNPLFGVEARALLDEVRRSRRNLGVTVVCRDRQFGFGVQTGIANVALDLIGKSRAQEKFPTLEASASQEWRTQVDQRLTDAYGAPEQHVALLAPLRSQQGVWHTVSIMVPETSETELRLALAVGIKAQARVAFFCDTAEQAEAMAIHAKKVLPEHRRIAYERAEAGQWGEGH